MIEKKTNIENVEIIEYINEMLNELQERINKGETGTFGKMLRTFPEHGNPSEWGVYKVIKAFKEGKGE